MDPSIETSAPPSAPAAASHHDDNEDLDPAKFLKSIRELSERREREDLERFRKLEAEVESSRAERARKKLQVEAVGAGATPAHVYSPAGVNNQQHLYTERRPSISPIKARSAHEILSATSARSESVINTPPPPPRPLSPSIAPLNPAMETNLAGPPSPTKDIPEFKGFSSARASNTPSAPPSAQTPDPASSRPSPSASSLGRTGTLSWQQRRPQSRGASRPASVVGIEENGLARDASRASRPSSGVGGEDTGHRGNASRPSRPTSGAGSEDTGHARNAFDQPEPSREQIAASLGSRDPAWFRQTAERGTGSAAYRKSKDEASTGHSVASSRRVLPGLARDTATEPSRRASPAPAENGRSEVASTPTSARDSGIASSRASATPSNSTQSKADLKSLLAEDEAQRQASPMSDHASSTGTEQHTDLSRNLSMSSSQARLANAPDRPSSPTKGMGGFVQSAMMKRSDSVSKRWSAQPGASLSRQNSTVSTRSGYNGLQGSRSMPRLEPTPSSREASNEPASRPTSSSSNLTALTQQREGDDVFVKPAVPHHSRSKSVASTYSTTADDKTAASPPSSPSKRFSPTKSSWIESALTKPESPKPSTARNAQPGWMANIAKAKAERASAESTPRTGTPRPPGDEGSRPASPVKSASAPFGPSLLRSASSRSLAAGVRSSTPPLMRTPVAGPREVPATDESTPSHLTEPSKTDGMEVPVRQVEPTPERQRSNARTFTAPQSEQAPERLPDATKTPTAPRSETREYNARPITLEPRPAAAKPALELPSSRSFISPSPSTPTKAKPEIFTKPKPETAPIPEQPLENAQTHTTSHADTHDSTARSVTGPPGAAAAKPAIELPSSRSITSPSPLTPTKVKPEVLTKAKPETPAKPQTDFRNTLRPPRAGETKSQGTPEFLSKFGQLRKTQPEKYVAPDILRDNITRGKAELARTGGPVKTPRRDELKESLLAKKEDWKKAKEEGRELPGQVHERKTSAGVPVTPPKPEALAKREWLGRSGEGGRAAGSPEKGREATPEALTRQRTRREEVKPEPAQARPPTIATHDHATSEPLSKQQSAPAVIEHVPAPATAEPSSKLAARFNPGLAGLLARGPPGSANTSNAPSRSGSPVVPQRATTLPSDGGKDGVSMEGSSEGPLKDMRKGRARGPKKRRGGGETGAADEDSAAKESTTAAREVDVKEEGDAPLSVPAVKPRAPVGSMAALMAASLEKAAATQGGGPASQKPVTSAKPSVAFEEWEAQKAAKPAKRTAAFGQAEEEREGLKPATPAKSSSTFAKVEEREMQKPAAPATPSAALAKQEEREGQKPATPAKSLAFSMKPSRTAQEPPKSDNAKPARATHEPIESNVQNFKGFGWNNRAAPTPKPEDNKENSDETLPSVKSAASFWGRQPPPKKADAPPQILLPSQRDEEAAMRSAGLLASSHTGSSSRDGSSNGLGISVEKRGGGSQATPPGSAGLPPRPVKSSRAVSGQLGEASVNKGVPRLMAVARPSTTAEKLLVSTFGVVPTSDVPLMIDTRALVGEEQGRPATEVKTLRRSTQEILPDGSVVTLRQQEQYTLFDSSVYICTHTYLTPTSTKRTQLFIWSGTTAPHSAFSHAQTAAKNLARGPGTLPLQTITQGHEPAPFLQALGGILITHRGSRFHASKQYVLCGRQHLGHIVFDEVDLGLGSLCAGFVFLISYPVTLQRTELYLWKGAACAMEEVCAARLVGMEISEMGGIEEVEQGGEDPKFLGIFGVGAVREGIAESSAMWEGKARAPGRFEIRLYRVEEVVQKVSLFAGLLSRRPSWNSRPPPSTRSASQDGADIKVEAKRISPFTQTDLEAEGIYVLDAYTKLYILVGPLFPSTPERVRDALLSQTLRFAEELARFPAENEGWEGSGRGFVILGGVPRDVKMLFRCWDEGRGLWGTAGLMAGSRGTRGDEVMMVRLDEVVRAVCK
ncbi:hypothetical protein LTR91_007057 [Friedmanniomyces endolithicus]|uniref:DUF4045 domain-containing protein n=1 Tax=Friedmanniomyces endolithicus TaxID=329885 RepID=A0AAN6KQP6_9PEZI|nr:hypothetical protein LTS00_013065 [Friedmanniomyces endolithicus]KAK0280396.1 hypothetical protein LTR35_008038 [Friedmanniomyces endolithicus]KAK0929875.1 hypothetical protein LTR57_001732 [Friedmanniomyces endolithicus]KAK0996084.1 hypothetical protein LTR91_007057 [Friedmanniomyces endolithicus]KAK1012931.1 hypothetical protein LTS01_000743 [Friedmanniomyces endolithicus]